MALSIEETAAIIGGAAGGAAVLGGVILLLYLFRDKDINIKLKLVYEDVQTGGAKPVPGGATVRVLDYDDNSTPFQMGTILVQADGVVDKAVNDDGTREINPDIMFEVTVPAPPPAPGNINWPAPGIASRQRRRDPMVGGISVIGVNSPYGSGTIGGPVSARNTANPMLLGCWHILSGQAPAPPHPAATPPVPPPAAAAANIIQPATGEAVPGTAANDLIGQLSNHRLGNFGRHDLDAAVAGLNSTRPAAGGGNEIVVLPRKLVDDEPAPGTANGPPAGVLGWEMIDDDLIRGIIPNSEIVNNIMGLEVWQSGRTSGVKRGQITGLGGIIRVVHNPVYPAPGYNHNVGDIIVARVRPDSPAYIIGAGGDSGALVLEVGTNRAIGIHFTGTNPQDMWACRLEPALNEFLVDLGVHRVEEDYHFRGLHRRSFFGANRTWNSRSNVPAAFRAESYFPSFSGTTLEKTIRLLLSGFQVHARFIYFDSTLARFMPLPEGIQVQIRDIRPGAARANLGTFTTNANGEIHAFFTPPAVDPRLAFRITRSPAARFPDDPSMRKIDRLGFFAGGGAVNHYESQNGAFLRYNPNGAVMLERNVPIVDDAEKDRKLAGSVGLPLVFPVAHIIGPAVARMGRDTTYRAYNGGAATTWGIRNRTKNIERLPHPANGDTLTYRPHTTGAVANRDAVGDRIRITSPRGGANSIEIILTDARSAFILSDPQARSFYPARDDDTGAATLYLDMPTPGREVAWERRPDATHHGQVNFDTGDGNSGTVVLTGTFPGWAQVRAVITDPAGNINTPYVSISVPQFVRVVFRDEFNADLVAFGLRRTAPAGGSLTDEQNNVNERVKQAVMDQALNVARWHFDNAGANVRFTTRDLTDLNPMPHVLIEVGGDRPAAGHAAVPANRNAGARMQLTRASNTGIFPGEFLNFSNKADRRGHAAPAAKDAQFDHIFDLLRPNSGAAGTAPVGKMDGGVIDFPLTPPAVGAANRTRYQRIVRAIRVLGNLIGEAIAHNTGHTLGLRHSAAAAARQLMDNEADRPFVERALSGSGLGAEFTHAEANSLHETVGKVQPFINQVNPNSGPVAGGTAIVITGRGFTSTADTRLTIMGVSVNNLNVVNQGEIRCNTPPRPMWAGPTRVFIANSEGTFLLPRGYAYT